MPYRLILVEPAGESEKSFTAPEVTIGRSKNNGLPIGSSVSSRMHCRLKQTDDGVILEDLGSRNGTLVNGKKVARPTRLYPGDCIEIGDSAVYFERKKLELVDSEEGGSGSASGPSEAPTPPPVVKTKVMDSGRAKAAKAKESGRAPAAAKSAKAQEPPADAPFEISIECTAGPESGKVFHLHDQLKVGRRRGNDIVLDDHEVSGQHARFVRKGRNLAILDLKSTNGTTVGGKRVVERAPLTDGSVVVIGSSRFKVRAPHLGAGGGVDEGDDSDDEVLSLGADEEAGDTVERPAGVGRTAPARRAAELADDAELQDTADEAEGSEDEQAVELADEDEEAEARPRAKPKPAKAAKPSKAPVPEDDNEPHVVTPVSRRALSIEAERWIARQNAISVVALVLSALLVVGSVFYAASFALTAASATGLEPPPQGGLVDNWSFEVLENGRPVSWQLEGAALDRHLPAGGLASLKLEPGGQARSRRVAVLSGQSYRASALWRLIDGGPAVLSIEWFDADGQPLGVPFSTEPMSGTRPWRVQAADVLVPVGATQAEVALSSQGGEVWCDRVTLGRAESEGGTPEDSSAVALALGLENGPLAAEVGRAAIPSLSLGGLPFVDAVELTLGPEGGMLGVQCYSKPEASKKTPQPGQILARRSIYNAATERWVNFEQAVQAEGERVAFRYVVPRGDLERLPALGLRIGISRTASVKGASLQGKPVGFAPGVRLDELSIFQGGREAAAQFPRAVVVAQVESDWRFTVVLAEDVLRSEWGAELDYGVSFGLSSKSRLSSVEGLLAEGRRLLREGRAGEARKVALEARQAARERSLIDRATELKDAADRELQLLVEEVHVLQRTLESLADAELADLVLLRCAALRLSASPEPTPLDEIARLERRAEELKNAEAKTRRNRKAEQLLARATAWSRVDRFALVLATLEEFLAIAPDHEKAAAAQEMMRVAKERLQARAQRRLE